MSQHTCFQFLYSSTHLQIWPRLQNLLPVCLESLRLLLNPAAHHPHLLRHHTYESLVVRKKNHSSRNRSIDLGQHRRSQSRRTSACNIRAPRDGDPLLHPFLPESTVRAPHRACMHTEQINIECSRTSTELRLFATHTVTVG